jgi:hypothetical protein
LIFLCGGGGGSGGCEGIWGTHEYRDRSNDRQNAYTKRIRKTHKAFTHLCRRQARDFGAARVPHEHHAARVADGPEVRVARDGVDRGAQVDLFLLLLCW